MIILYIAMAVSILIILRLIDYTNQRRMMRQFNQNGKKLSPVSKKIVERWQNDCKKLFSLIDKIDTSKLDVEDKKNLALGVDSLHMLYPAIESIIGTGVRRYKTRFAKLLQESAKLIIEVSAKAAVK